MSGFSILTNSAAETEELGRRLGSLLQAGDFLALRGELGGGKTCFTRGVVAALAPESAHLVASPTYAIMNEYPGRPAVYHFDFYRFNSVDEVIELGFEDYFHGCGICVAEWSERIYELLPADHISVCFEHRDGDQRLIIIETNTPETIKRIGNICLPKTAKKL